MIWLQIVGCIQMIFGNRWCKEQLDRGECGMSKLNIDQQTIKELFTNKKADFLIPDYQRPYAWEETECQT